MLYLLLSDTSTYIIQTFATELVCKKNCFILYLTYSGFVIITDLLSDAHKYLEKNCSCVSHDFTLKSS